MISGRREKKIGKACADFSHIDLQARGLHSTRVFRSAKQPSASAGRGEDLKNAVGDLCSFTLRVLGG